MKNKTSKEKFLWTFHIKLLLFLFFFLHDKQSSHQVTISHALLRPTNKGSALPLCQTRLPVDFCLLLFLHRKCLQERIANLNEVKTQLPQLLQGN